MKIFYPLNLAEIFMRFKAVFFVLSLGNAYFKHQRVLTANFTLFNPLLNIILWNCLWTMNSQSRCCSKEASLGENITHDLTRSNQEGCVLQMAWVFVAFLSTRIKRKLLVLGCFWNFFIAVFLIGFQEIDMAMWSNSIGHPDIFQWFIWC